MTILEIIENLLKAFTAIVGLYMLFRGVFGIRRYVDKINLDKHCPQKRFALVIPARNEQNVIANLIRNLRFIDYPNELYDIFVIADNCDDDTAKVAREAGAIVFERNEPDKRSKGYALKFFISRLRTYEKEYDAIGVFDADNLVKPCFLKRMDAELCQGHIMLQGYKDIKNPYDTWVTQCYAIFNWQLDRFYHLPRGRANIGTLLNGSGFIIATDYLFKYGWETNSLVEDLEYAIHGVLRGVGVKWVHGAIVYDEQPLEFSTSWTQRKRWMAGIWYCTRHYSLKLFAYAIKNLNLGAFDVGMYTCMFLSGIIGMTVCIWDFINIWIASGVWPATQFLLWAAFIAIVVQIAFAFAVVHSEGKDMKKCIPGCLLCPLFNATTVLLSARAIIMPNATWVPIKHTRNIDLGYIIDQEDKK